VETRCDEPREAISGVPAAYAVTEDAVLILDTLKSRVVEYRDGEITRAVPVPGLIQGRSIAVGADRDWYVYDALGTKVIRLSPSGKVKKEWPLPGYEREMGIIRLKQARDGDVVIWLCGTEWALGRPFSSRIDGLTYPNHRGRYTVRRWNRRTAVIYEDGRERWRVRGAGGEISPRLLGFDRDGRLIMQAADSALEDEMLVYALYPYGGVIRGFEDISAYDEWPDTALVVGQDGALYRLAFTKEKAVLQRLRFERAR